MEVWAAVDSFLAVACPVSVVPVVVALVEAFVVDVAVVVFVAVGVLGGVAAVAGCLAVAAAVVAHFRRAD